MRFASLISVLGIASSFFALSAARAETVTLSTGDCSKLVAHQPADDVTYKPGVDVRGKPVVPADLGGGSAVKIPESIDIQIGIDLADRLALRDARKSGAPATTRKVLPFEGKAPLGTLSVKGNDVYWNGERIAPQDELLLAEACHKGLTAAGVTLPTSKPKPPNP